MKCEVENGQVVVVAWFWVDVNKVINERESFSISISQPSHPYRQKIAN